MRLPSTITFQRFIVPVKNRNTELCIRRLGHTTFNCEQN